MVNRVGQYIGPHDHARAAAKWGIVHGTVFIARKIANVHRFQLPKPISQGFAC
jgi:hypothetical protein